VAQFPTKCTAAIDYTEVDGTKSREVEYSVAYPPRVDCVFSVSGNVGFARWRQ
jgi:hypothetical protein